MTTQPDRLPPAEALCAGAALFATDPRAEFARSAGRAQAGERVTLALRSSQLPSVMDLLGDAVRSMLPLVVRVTIDDDDGGLFAAADTGAGVLIARPDETATVHLIARLLTERALLPVVLACRQDPKAKEPGPLPRAALDLLGDPADIVPSKTPAQEQLFGGNRRRVVRWFDPERPVLRGQATEPPFRLLQRAGLAPFVLAPVHQLLRDVAAEVQLATGTAWSAVDTTDTSKADVLVVALAGTCPDIGIADRNAKEPRVGFVTLNCLRPFPESWLGELRRKRAAIALAGSDGALAGDPPLLREVRAALLRRQAEDRAAGKAWKDREVPTLHTALTGLAGEPATGDDVRAFVRECAAGKGRPLVYLGVDFAPLDGTTPKRRILHETLRRAHPGIETLGLRTAPPPVGEPLPPAPVRIAPPTHPQPRHDDLARCQDTAGAPVASGRLGALAPDPYLTAGSTPALTSLFRGNAPGGELPELDPSRCTGCGACWTACPDGALLPGAIPARDLLDALVRRAASTGHATTALSPLIGRLAKALPKAIANGALHFQDALRTAAEKTLAKLDDERREAAGAAIEAVAAAGGALPVMCPEVFDGAVFVLGLDPDACKGCNLCLRVCEPEALSARPRSDDLVESARAVAATWRALPDTPGAIAKAARERSEPGTDAALQLSRHCLLALAPGDDAEPGSGARIALRTVLAAAEAHLQPRLQRHLQDLDELSNELSERIRSLLASALPASDLDALHEGLATLGQGATTLAALAARLDNAVVDGRVDTARLQRFVETARAVSDLRWRIAQGTTGRGRSRAGLVLTGKNATTLADHYPWNPFAMPAVVDTHREAGHLALGLLQGTASAIAADVAMLRRAHALLAQGAPGPRHLAFGDLSDDERLLCPPLWLIADAAELQHGGLQLLGAALGSTLPVKILLLSTTPLTEAPLTAPLLALAHREAYVLQSSISHRDHLANGALAASEHAGPALLHVLAPSPSASGAAPDSAIALAADAVASRAFPLLDYAPNRPGAFGEKLSLDGNPEPTEDGCEDPERLEAWRTLQELAGVRSPFTADIERRAAAEVAAEHARELDDLRARHEAELRRARAAVEEELVARLQRKLVTLSAGGRRS